MDIDPFRKRERERQLAERLIEEQTAAAAANGEAGEGAGAGALVKKSNFDAAAEFAKLVGTRTGGAYIPPSRLRAMQRDAEKDKSSAEWQRMTWDALRKSINGLINKVRCPDLIIHLPRPFDFNADTDTDCGRLRWKQVNTSNIKYIIPEMFQENLIRGRGLFARAIMKAQASSLPFTPVFASLVAIINTKLPMVGELVLIRLVSQWRRAFKRDDKVSFHIPNRKLCVEEIGGLIGDVMLGII